MLVKFTFAAVICSVFRNNPYNNLKNSIYFTRRGNYWRLTRAYLEKKNYDLQKDIDRLYRETIVGVSQDQEEPKRSIY